MADLSLPFFAPFNASSVSGTSELFSSTLAMLSDAAPPFPEQWNKDPEPSFYYPTASAAASSVTDEFGRVIQGTYPPPHVEPTFDPAYQMRARLLEPHALLHQPQPIQLQGMHEYRPLYIDHSTLPAQAPLAPPPIIPPPLSRPTPVYQQPLHMQGMPPIDPTQTLGSLVQNIHQQNGVPQPPKPVKKPRKQKKQEELDVKPLLIAPIIGEDGEPRPHPELEMVDEERVMCMACRGVYPSRRSLTGHIGRNEKCREIIGRNYLDTIATTGIIPQVPGAGTEQTPKGAICTGQDGLSPICPYCDRFISHYKGNIRRHINQCGKTGGKRERTKGEKKAKEAKRKKRDSQGASVSPDEWNGPSDHIMDGYEHMYGQPQPSSLPSLCLSPPTVGLGYQNGMHPHHLIDPSIVPAPAAAALPKKENEVPDDPYLCPDCDFLTVYKGNMKRHLNTCHPHLLAGTDVKENDRRLEAMKASVQGVEGERLQEKVAAHKANSTRGRKSKQRREQQGDKMMVMCSPVEMSGAGSLSMNSSMGSSLDSDEHIRSDYAAPTFFDQSVYAPTTSSSLTCPAPSTPYYLTMDTPNSPLDDIIDSVASNRSSSEEKRRRGW